LNLSVGLTICGQFDDLPKLVRVGPRGFAVVEPRHVFDLRCDHVDLAVWSPAEWVWPKQTFVRYDLLDALVRGIPTHDRAVFKIGKIKLLSGPSSLKRVVRCFVVGQGLVLVLAVQR
jgi:hypothetical protein